MHCLLTVSLPGTTKPEDVPAALFRAVDCYTHLEQPEGPPGGGEWDGGVVGGRWHGSFTLTPDAVDRRRKGTLDLPPESDCHNVRGCIDHPLSRTDCARLGDIDPDLLKVPFYWLDLSGRRHELDYDPDHVPVTDINEIRRARESQAHRRHYDRLEEVNSRRFREWIQSLDPATWLVAVDVHR